MKYPPKAYVSSVWSPVGGTILGCSENLRRWGLVGRRRSLGDMTLKVIPSPQSLPHSLLPVSHKVNIPLLHMLPP
jgi:hypothetical protein